MQRIDLRCLFKAVPQKPKHFHRWAMQYSFRLHHFDLNLWRSFITPWPSQLLLIAPVYVLLLSLLYFHCRTFFNRYFIQLLNPVVFTLNRSWRTLRPRLASCIPLGSASQLWQSLITQYNKVLFSGWGTQRCFKGYTNFCKCLHNDIVTWKCNNNCTYNSIFVLMITVN